MSQRSAHREGSRSVAFYLAALACLQVVSLLGLIGFGAANDFRRARASAQERAGSDAEHAAHLISAAVATARTMLASEAALPGYGDVFADPGSCTLRSSEVGVFLASDIHIVRSDGSVACTSTRSPAGPGYASSPWFAPLAEAREPIVVGPVVDPLTGRSTLVLGVRLASAPGALVLSLDVAELAAGLERELGGPMPRPAFEVTTSDATVIALPDDVRATPLIDASAAAEELGWHVRAALRRSDALASARTQLRDRLAFAGVVVLLILGATRAVNRRIGRPLRALASALDDGCLPAQVSEDGPSEVGRVGRSFNRLLRERAEDNVGFEMFPERRGGERREVDRMKSSFLMAVSHELRTPLTVLSGFASTLERRYDDLSRDKVHDYVRRIAKAANRLDRLLLDILDVERLSRGVLESRRRPTYIRRLVQRMLEVSDTTDDVTVEVPAGLVASVDPAFVERIVDNLVSNAMKHTPPGTAIWVRAERRGRELVLMVDDAGNGVPDEWKDEVFEPFRRISPADDGVSGDADSRYTPGTGVGLALVAQFARVHGGRAWVQDSAEGGASFRVSFPDATVRSREPVERQLVKR